MCRRRIKQKLRAKKNQKLIKPDSQATYIDIALTN